MTIDAIRTAYLHFFASHGHAVVPSANIVPENDPTTLFTGSGMQPMVPYLLGETHPKGVRIVDSQKCFRTQDIEEVGDNRHTTFFEMLGNWSLGDYFKKEQLQWLFTFLVDELGLPPERLFVTVFSGNASLGIDQDDESVEIWQSIFSKVGIRAEAKKDSETKGMQGGRIFYYDETKNWWSRAGVPDNMPSGEPGGPDSEVFYDFGEDRGLHLASLWKELPCHVNCDCGRFLEIGNSVFMQFQKQSDGSFIPLANQNVDYGGGLERIGAAVIDNPDVFCTSGFMPIIRFLEDKTNKSYDDLDVQFSFRVIADHARAAVMLSADGVKPSNKEQGYFLRRVIRRAIRHAKLINAKESLLSELVPVVATIYKDVYPDVTANLKTIVSEIEQEEHRFSKALDRGLAEIEKITQIDGATAFKLYETYGFPFELTQEIALERGQDLKKEDFDVAKADHAVKSRTASAGRFKGGLQDSSEVTTQYHTATHLLHAALRKILGNHVQQKGSHITDARARFDFSHDSAVTADQIKSIETQINEWISQALPVTSESKPKQAALNDGALA
ncbi:MAG: alanine--tRNA ligase, partial [Microgenomates group bacterium]